MVVFMMFFSDSYRSRSHTRTRSPYCWAHLRRRRSFSSRSVTGAVTRTHTRTYKHKKHTHIQYIQYMHTHTYHPLYRQLHQMTGKPFPGWSSKVGVHKQEHMTSGTFLISGCLQTIQSQRNLRRKWYDSVYSTDLFLCNHHPLVCPNICPSYEFSLSHMQRPKKPQKNSYTSAALPAKHNFGCWDTLTAIEWSKGKESGGLWKARFFWWAQ